MKQKYRSEAEKAAGLEAEILSLKASLDRAGEDAINDSSAHEKQLAALQQRLEDAKLATAKAHDEFDSARALNDSLRIEVEQEKSAAAQREAELEAKISTLDAALESDEQRFKTLQGELAAEASLEEKLRARLQEMEDNAEVMEDLKAVSVLCVRVVVCALLKTNARVG